MGWVENIGMRKNSLTWTFILLSALIVGTVGGTAMYINEIISKP